VAVEVDVARKLSITFDEPSHIGAGLSYMAHGDLVLNPEHPPLVKLLAGAAIAALGAKESSAAFLAAARGHPEAASDSRFATGSGSSSTTTPTSTSPARGPAPTRS
jgi:hypothetical protein